MSAYQLDLLEPEFEQVDAMAYFSDSDIERGEVFTRREVVEFVLDLSGWQESSDLSEAKLLEPSCGSGDFLIPAVERLLGSRKWQMGELLLRIRAVEVNRGAFEKCRDQVDSLLEIHKFDERERRELLDNWLIHADFLTCSFETDFTHVVGNPPYVRQEALPNELLKLYRARFSTMYDRADLYVPFFERGLTLLKDKGCLAFICADRWMKNKYGGPLRKMVSQNFHLESYVDFTGCPAFHDEVIAYPAVTVIRKGSGTTTRTASRPEVDFEKLQNLANSFSTESGNAQVTSALNVVSGNEPWLLENPARLNVVRNLESLFPAIEEAGCRVGIGVATGLDQVYIRKDEELPVESDRKIPLATTRDVVDGELVWSGKMLLNPFDGDSPRLVNPNEFPLFKEYLEEHRERISRRHVARKNPKNWFKTIDRIYPSLTKTPKLLIPDIKGEASVVYDKGEFYPHHNFYYLTSEEWDLHALQAVLLSSLTQAFIATYSLRMRGDCLRYQAQYLRRLRLPKWSSLAKGLRNELASAGRAQDKEKIEELVREVYGVSVEDWQLLKS